MFPWRSTSFLYKYIKYISLCQVRSKRLHNYTHVPCSLQSPHYKGIGMISSIWKRLLNRSVRDTRIVTPLIYIYIYIRGVTVHKIYCSVRYDTVVSRFSMFSIQGAGQLVTFTFMHLSDAFIQSVQVIQFLSVCVFPGNWTHNLLRCKRNALPLSHRNIRNDAVAGYVAKLEIFLF